MLSQKVTTQEQKEILYLPFSAASTGSSRYNGVEMQWLAMENALHKRLANVVDLDEAIDGFAVWLSRVVPHDLVGFSDAGTGRSHFFCSSHGPNKHVTISRAEAVMKNGSCGCADGQCIVHELQTPHGRGMVLVLRNEAPFRPWEAQVIERGLEILERTLERVLYYEILYQQSRIDALTGVPNRRVFQETVEQATADAMRYRRPLSLAILDLDHFKEINDTLGHDAGDETLKRVADTISSTIRSTDLLARLGGDEFALLMPNTSLEQAKVLAQRIIDEIDGMAISTPDGHRLGISMGICQWDGSADLAEWIKRTDALLYQAKNQGRNRFVAGR